MNLFQEAKTILSKDGKVNPLGPYGKMKLMGKEVSTYFRRNPVKDAEIKKAVEVALDMSGAMTQAAQEIKRFYGDKILKSKEVQQALRYSNESTTLEGETLDEDYKKVIKMYPRDKEWKQLITKHKKAINDFRKKGFNKDLPFKVEDELVSWASQTGEISHKEDIEDFIMSILDEKFKPYNDKQYPRCVDFYIQFRGGKGDRITSEENKKDFIKATDMIDAYCKKNKIKQKPVYSTPQEGSSAYKVGLMIDKSYSKTSDYKDGKDLQPLYVALSKLKTAEDHGGGWDKLAEETISEAPKLKNLMPEFEKIVKTKGAAKVQGTMVDMFTASVIVKAYAQVNDKNKKRMETSNVFTLIKLAQKVMGLKEETTLTEGMSKLLSPAQQKGVLKKWNEPEDSTFAKDVYSNAKIANKKDFIVTSHPVKDGDYYLSLLGNAPEGKEDKPLTTANTNMNADIRKICKKWSTAGKTSPNPAGMCYLEIERELCNKKYNKFAAADTMVREVVWGMVEDIMGIKIKTG